MGLGYNGREYKLKIIDLSDNTQVNSGGSTNTQTLQPASGKAYQVIGMYYTAPAPVGDTSGTHQLEIFQNDGTTSLSLIRAIGNHSTTVGIYRYQIYADSSEAPSNAEVQGNILKNGLWASNGTYLDFTYTNDTDANQTGTRTLEIVVKEFSEAI